MRKSLFILLPLLLLAPLSASAMVVKAGETYVLTSQEIIAGNLYAVGGTAQLSGTVEGDAAVAGGNVTISGEIKKDLMVAGGTVLLLGNVGEDVRAAGGNVTMIGDIGGELMAAGGMLTVSPDVVVGGDVFVSGGTIVLDGVIEGNVEVYGEEVKIVGKISGSVIGKMTKLTIADTATIGGNLAYEAPEEAVVAPGTVAGAVDFKRLEEPQVAPPDIEGAVRGASRAIAGVFAILAVLKYLATLATGLILVFWFSKKSTRVINEASASFGSSLLLGLGVAIAGPVAMFMLLFTGIGSGIAAMGFAVLTILYILGATYAGIMLGALIIKAWKKSPQAFGNWKSALLGITLLSAIATIPFIGFLFKGVFLLASIGAMSKLYYVHLQADK